ncbi:hypothetical protein ACMA1D_18160 [Streptomyces sp. 796.1]|uniref:hypothetical protein n=1 Tax=Streptomyces sp. 796.1 TaxID=3163029 RepID=UPI0039C92125
MEKTLPSGLAAGPLGRCVASFCSAPANTVVTFSPRGMAARLGPRAYCNAHVELLFVDDETYEARHRAHPGGLGPRVFQRSMYEIREPSDAEAAELAHERAAGERWAAEGRVGSYRRIVELHSVTTIDGLLVDAWTAGACVALYDALNEANRERWLAMPVAQQCEVAVRLVMGGRS